MAQQRPRDDDSVSEVLKLVDRLSAEQRQELYRRLNLKAWSEQWRALSAKVDEQNEGKPQLTEEEVMSEMAVLRSELKQERAQGNS